jgi:hypothetical protein
VSINSLRQIFKILLNMISFLKNREL